MTSKDSQLLFFAATRHLPSRRAGSAAEQARVEVIEVVSLESRGLKGYRESWFAWPRANWQVSVQSKIPTSPMSPSRVTVRADRCRTVASSARREEMFFAVRTTGNLERGFTPTLRHRAACGGLLDGFGYVDDVSRRVATGSIPTHQPGSGRLRWRPAVCRLLGE